MLKGLFGAKRREKQDISSRIQNIQNGDDNDREAFIQEYTPFILKNLSQITHCFIEVENSEEYSVGLMAFNEAIDRYDPQLSTSFISFAARVIRSRIYDYYRKENKQKKCISLSLDDDTGNHQPFIDHSQQKRVETRLELYEFSQGLASYHISLEDLVQKAPKHLDTRLQSAQVAKTIVDNPHLSQQLRNKKTLPIKDLIDILPVGKKMLNRNRKFIIAICVILWSDLTELKSYVEGLVSLKEVEK